MRFQDAAPDARHIVYAGIQSDPLVAEAAALLANASADQRILARAVMNGETTNADAWRGMFPSLFGPAVDADDRASSEAILATSLRVADRGEQARSQYRGAIVESLTEILLSRRSASVRRERRVLFDRVRSEIHPYDVTVEDPDAPEVYDCKWGARGINADVLLQLDDARTNAIGEGGRLVVGLVVFDAARSCAARLVHQTAPRAGTRIVTIESLDGLRRARRPTPPSADRRAVQP
jgi:hypothetical protein